MNNKQIECSDCGELYEEDEMENCEGCGDDFCAYCLDADGYCSDCE